MAKVLVSLDDRLLDRVDRAAKAAGKTRSAFLAEMVARELGVAKDAVRAARIRAALRELRTIADKYPPGGDSTAIIRSMRDSR